jgi:hypothetical protein
MTLNPKDAQILADYRAERDELLVRVKRLERIIAAIEGDDVSPRGAGQQRRRSPETRVRRAAAEVEGSPLPANTWLGGEGEFVNLTLRQAVRKYLQAAGGPRPSPVIAQALHQDGFPHDYAKLKTNVDATLHRLKRDGVVEKVRDGWRLVLKHAVAA